MSQADSTPLKRCRKCGTEKPFSEFSKSNDEKPICDACLLEKKLKKQAYDRERYLNNPEVAWRRSRQWRIQNPEKAKESDRRKRRPEKDREYGRRYRAKHPERNKERTKRYRLKNADMYRAAVHRRRARRAELPMIWSMDDLQRMMEYWHYSCAICGRPAGLWHTIAADHWIPLTSSDCPGTVPTNMLPLCHAKKGSGGQGSCNVSKGNKDPVEWLISHLGKRKAKLKLAEIEAYFASVR